MLEDNLKMAEKIAASVAERGGRAFFVGGCVRDRLLGMENKDIDIEIHGISYEALKEILESFGTLMVIGASFGVFGLKGYDLDIAMPRKEKATGRGHRDFEIDVDPFIGPEKAAVRRDFTVNAMLEDILTGEVLDFFRGREDLENGIIRHVNRETFVEDPLRVLRAAQFAARFGFDISDETRELCAGMDLSFLPAERVFEEMKKALLKAERPSVFFEELRRMDSLKVWFPEAEKLIGVRQSPKHHPEGDVWTHTMLVLDRAAELRDRAVDPTGLMLSALCHDFGKVLTTTEENGEIHSYNHENAGLDEIAVFIRRITKENDLLKYVLNMTRLHMRPRVLVKDGASEKAFMRMYDESLEPRDLLLLTRADKTGTTKDVDYSKRELILEDMLKRYDELMSRPYVMGADLIEAGFEPSPLFSEALQYAHKHRLAGMPKEESLAQTIGYLKTLEKEHNAAK